MHITSPVFGVLNRIRILPRDAIAERRTAYGVRTAVSDGCIHLPVVWIFNGSRCFYRLPYV